MSQQRADEPYRALVERERHFSQAVIESLPGLFYRVDQHGRLLEWNDNFEKVSGYSAGELAGRSVLDFFRESDHASITEGIRRSFSTGEALVEGSFVSKDQSQTPYLFSGKRFLNDGETCLIGLGIDITARKELEASRHSSEAALMEAQRIAGVGSFSMDARHRRSPVVSRPEPHSSPRSPPAGADLRHPRAVLYARKLGTADACCGEGARDRLAGPARVGNGPR